MVGNLVTKNSDLAPIRVQQKVISLKIKPRLLPSITCSAIHTSIWPRAREVFGCKKDALAPGPLPCGISDRERLHPER
jgi:hypothetical protein